MATSDTTYRYDAFVAVMAKRRLSEAEDALDALNARLEAAEANGEPHVHLLHLIQKAVEELASAETEAAQ